MRLNVTVDWNQLSQGSHQGEVTVSAGNDRAIIKINAKKYAIPSVKGHYFGGAGEFSIPAYQYNRISAGKMLNGNLHRILVARKVACSLNLLPLPVRKLLMLRV